jgi:XTP/dITP diphosphohydrolase
MRLLVATTNANKVREIRGLLASVPCELITLDAYPAVSAPEETGRTFEENARQKALYYAATTGELTVAEDSGLEIDALGGAPGVESARFGGVETSYPQKFAMLYEALRVAGRGARGSDTVSDPGSDTGSDTVSDPAGGESAARFVCAVALARGDRVLFEARGTVEGLIAREPKGDGGFGYDPIFFYPPYDRTLAEVPQAQKSVVSHRGAAFRKLREFLLFGIEQQASQSRDLV